MSTLVPFLAAKSTQTPALTLALSHLAAYGKRARGLSGLWLALVLLASSAGLVSTAVAQGQDDGSQQQPQWRARTAARQYPDDAVPGRTAAASDQTPNLIPPPPVNVESPSSQPARPKKAKPAGDATRGAAVPAGETVPTPKVPPARRVESAEEMPPAIDDGQVFGDRPENDDNGFGCSMPGMRCMLHDRVWFRGEALLWWLKGGQTPPLLTTSPASTPQNEAGVLGEPNTTILFGNQELNQGLHAGARLSFGTWLDCNEQSGLEFSYMAIGANTQTYDSPASMGNPILARPFFNTSTGAEDSQLVAFPNAWTGSFHASSTETLQGAEALWRRAIVAGSDGRIDVLLGYRFNRLTDGLFISDTATSAGTAATSPGTTFNVADSFHTQNDFNGADLGFSTQWRQNRWTFETMLKIGVGATHSQVLINGATAIITNGSTVNYNGGLLALPSNMGNHDSNQFTVMPEIGFTLAYDLTPYWKASFGYTLLYWSNVVRPGDQIDTNIDTAQLPPPTAVGEKPAFVLHTSDFWAQGISLGLEYKF